MRSLVYHKEPERLVSRLLDANFGSHLHSFRPMTIVDDLQGRNGTRYIDVPCTIDAGCLTEAARISCKRFC
jgi:hypothetical protein